MKALTIPLESIATDSSGWWVICGDWIDEVDTTIKVIKENIIDTDTYDFCSGLDPYEKKFRLTFSDLDL